MPSPPPASDPPPSGPRTVQTAESRRVPWTLAAVTLAATCIILGLLWDISWHRTIGRDTFLTPAHVAIYLGAVIAGVTCGALALRTTFAGDPAARAISVGFWGFRAPLGAWVCIWGSFAMLTSAPFDNWWHNAYGLDVQILSPPHTLLGVGMIAIQIGAMLMVLAHQNRTAASGGPLSRLFVYCAGIALLMMATIVWEYTGFANDMHGSLFYKVAALSLPAFLLAPARASRMRWPATRVALVYMGLTLFMAWTLPLVPATARLAPVYNPPTHLLPPTFPLLLFVPALAFDLLLPRLAHWREWQQAVVLGMAFVLTLLAVQWPFAVFLLSPAARNAFFVADRWDYSSLLGPWRYRWWSLDRNAAGGWDALGFWSGIGVAVLLAGVSAWWGLVRGRWMRGVQR
jgi:hypothetical protein